MTLLKENQIIREKIHDHFEKLDLDAPKGYFSEINRLGNEIYLITKMMKLHDAKNIEFKLENMYDERVNHLNIEFDEKNVPKNLRLGKFEK